MKKNTSPVIPEKTDGKSAFYHAGEIIGSLGFHIVDGKDKVIGAIRNKLSKKQPPESKAKKVSKKKYWKNRKENNRRCQKRDKKGESCKGCQGKSRQS